MTRALCELSLSLVRKCRVTGEAGCWLVVAMCKENTSVFNYPEGHIPGG